MDKLIPITVTAGSGAPLYVAESKIYPRDVRGRYDTLRRTAVVLLLGMYYVFPWLSWGGRQAVLFDLPARKFYVFGLAFWPQDFFYLALLLIMAGIALFFFTTLAGRLWCGYACPQTVWTEVFLWMERWTEGDRAKRMKLDASPWTREKWLRKVGKHLLWLGFALWTGFTFVGFFTPIRELGANLLPFRWGGWETFWVLFYGFATWGNAGVLREQVCKYMCPYARFQGAMFDRDTLVIAYDPLRGEPRGSRKRGLASVLERARGLLSPALAEQWLAQAQCAPSAADRRVDARRTTGAFEREIDGTAVERAAPESLGDCIDCTLCVQVCPTGIDIRNGLQYECIACGACIDACDQVMDKLGYPRGLIRYTTQHGIDGKPARVLRPRIWVYGSLLLALAIGWGWGVTHRTPLIAEVLRDRNALYREAQDGSVENGYTLKLVNKRDVATRLRIRVEAAGPIALRDGPFEVDADAEAVITVPLTLVAPRDSVHGRWEVVFAIESLQASPTQLTATSAFFAPP